LREAVERVRGAPQAAHGEPELKLPVVAVLPESYIPEPMQRLALYQRMAQATSDAAIYEVLGDVEDRYGEAPEEARLLVDTMLIRRRLVVLGGASIGADVVDGTLKIAVGFVPEAPIARGAIVALCQREPARYQLSPAGRLVVQRPASGEQSPRELLRAVRDELEALPRAAPTLAGG